MIHTVQGTPAPPADVVTPFQKNGYYLASGLLPSLLMDCAAFDVKDGGHDFTKPDVYLSSEHVKRLVCCWELGAYLMQLSATKEAFGVFAACCAWPPRVEAEHANPDSAITAVLFLEDRNKAGVMVRTGDDAWANFVVSRGDVLFLAPTTVMTDSKDKPGASILVKSVPVYSHNPPAVMLNVGKGFFFDYAPAGTITD